MRYIQVLTCVAGCDKQVDFESRAYTSQVIKVLTLNMEAKSR